MKMDQNNPVHYMILAGIGITFGTVFAALLLFLFGDIDFMPIWSRVFMGVVVVVGSFIWAYTNRPKKRN